MRLEAKHLWRGLLLCALALTACRVGDSVCGAAGCDALGEAGGGGAGGEANGHAGDTAYGGGAGEEDPGVSPSSGRWLVFIGNDSGELPLELRAVRLEGVTHRPSISISEGVPGELLDVDTWSPDGRHLIGLSAPSPAQLDQRRLFHVEFGAGLPTIETSIPGLPMGTTVTSGPWAGDSTAVFAYSLGSRAETYLVHMTSGGTRTELLYSDEDDFPTMGFCPDPRFITRTLQANTWIVDSLHPEQEHLLWSGPGFVGQSPDGRFLLYQDEDTGVWLARCEAGTEVLHLTDQFDLGEWSADGRFLLLAPEDGPEIDVLDSERNFQSVFKSPCLVARLASKGSTLFLVCESDESSERSISEVDLTTIPAKVSRRGSFQAGDPEFWSVTDDGLISIERPESGELMSLWVLPRGTEEWRRVASGLSDEALDFFTPDGNFVIYSNPRSDGSKEFLAFSLHNEQPVAIPLLPAPASTLGFVDFYAGGVLVDHIADHDFPFEGDIWWAPLGPSSFGPPLRVTDTLFAGYPRLQPQP